MNTAIVWTNNLDEIMDVTCYKTPCGVTPPILDTKCKGHFSHKTKGHFKHSRWWKTWSWTKFASHYAQGTNGVCECKMDEKSTWHQMNHFSWSPGLFSKNHFLEVGLTQNQEAMAL
jgi:hypothetical protein